MRNLVQRAWVCSGLLLAAGACNQGPTEEDYDDVAAGIGALVSNGSDAGELGSMNDGIMVAKGDVPAGISAMGSGSFEGDRLGLRYAYGVTCLDAGGATQALCDATTTDSARLTVDWSGELTLPRFRAAIDRTGDWTLTGIQTDTAEFNGQGTFDVESEFMALFRPVTNTFILDYDAQYEGVRIQTANGEAVGGQIRYDVDAKRTRDGRFSSVEAEFTMEAIVTFTADGADLVLDGSRRYDLDLSNGAIVRQ